jgi:hypothetical protein
MSVQLLAWPSFNTEDQINLNKKSIMLSLNKWSFIHNQEPWTCESHNKIKIWFNIMLMSEMWTILLSEFKEYMHLFLCKKQQTIKAIQLNVHTCWCRRQFCVFWFMKQILSSFLTDLHVKKAHYCFRYLTVTGAGTAVSKLTKLPAAWSENLGSTPGRGRDYLLLHMLISSSEA